MTITAQPSRQARRAQVRKSDCTTARQTQRKQDQDLAEEIIDAATAKTAAAAQAASLVKAELAEIEVQAWLKDMNARLDVIQQHPEQNLGEIEEQLARSVKEPLRLIAQRAAQTKANAVPCQCPECDGELTHQKFLPRTIHSRFGPLTIWRRYGFCPRGGVWLFPAEYA